MGGLQGKLQGSGRTSHATRTNQVKPKPLVEEKLEGTTASGTEVAVAPHPEDAHVYDRLEFKKQIPSDEIPLVPHEEENSYGAHFTDVHINPYQPVAEDASRIAREDAESREMSANYKFAVEQAGYNGTFTDFSALYNDHGIDELALLDLHCYDENRDVYEGQIDRWIIQNKSDAYIQLSLYKLATMQYELNSAQAPQVNDFKSWLFENANALSIDLNVLTELGFFKESPVPSLVSEDLGQ